MRSLVVGFGLSLSLAVMSVALVTGGGLLGFGSADSPFAWPAFLMASAGLPFAYIVDAVPALSQAIAIFIPPGSGPAAAIAVFCCGIVVWGCILSAVVQSWRKFRP